MNRDLRDIVLMVVCIVVLMTCVSGWAAHSYGRTELRAFNRLNGTSYTMDEWRVYRYEIIKLHPLKEARE